MKKQSLRGEEVKKKISKKNNGITLIALVITIIVLLILAGVTIATLTGENGILTRASEASEKTKQANVEEQVKLAIAASIGTNGKIDTGKLNEELQKIEGEKTGIPVSSLPADITIDGYEVHIDGNGVVSVGDNSENSEEGNIKEYTEDGVPIPNGFYYVGGTKAEGVVISDNPDDENKGTSWEVAKTLKGNQFVWVPVEDDSAFKTYDGYMMGQIQSDYMEENMSMPNFFESCQEPYLFGYATEESEHEAMKTSVLEHDGFYVGRYEAGTAGAERGEESGITDDVVVKQGANVYNYIGWSNSNDMTNETGGAVQKAKEFANKKGYTSVTSTLIYGVQWDAIMAWIEPRYKDSNNAKDLLAEKNFVADSTGKGNYTGDLAVTGSSDEYDQKNIYDLAGNVDEWTMESCNTHSRVIRGGDYSFTGAYSPASTRGYIYPSNGYVYVGFRLTLYL